MKSRGEGQDTQYSSATGGLLRNTRTPQRGLLVPAPPRSPARIGKEEKGRPIRRELCPLVVAKSSAGHPLTSPVSSQRTFVLSLLVPFMVRQAHHERKKSVHPELVEG